MIVATFRGGVPLWLPAWLVEWLTARDERRARAIALEVLGNWKRREGSDNGETNTAGRDTPQRASE